MPVPILTTGQMRLWEEATWRAGVTEAAVIEAVGKAVAARAITLTAPGARILVVAGKGHNGDDARAAVPHLTGREVQLISVTDPALAQAALKDLRPPQPSLLIDGLFGIGLSRPLDQGWIDLIAAINASGIPVLAVDLPSGLNADSGAPQPVAVRARVTLTVGSPKIGLLQPSAWEYVGALSVAHRVGLILPCPVETQLRWTLAEDFSNFPPPRRASDHKGAFGHAVLVAGSVGYHGAGVLAARGALQAAPGLVSLLTTAEAYVPIASQLQAAMVNLFSVRNLPPKLTAILFGPGLAQAGLPAAFRDGLRETWNGRTVPLIVDASALDWVSKGSPVPALRVITPHPGEAARMLETDVATVQGDRLGSARALSEQFGHCHVVLKGHETIVTGPDGVAWVNSTGNPLMAQGGSGDILAGYLTGLLAQPLLAEQPLQTLRYGVWQHGLAGDQLSNSRRRWSVEELPELLGSASPETVYPNESALK